MTIEKPTGREEIAKARLQIVCRNDLLSKFNPGHGLIAEVYAATVTSVTTGYGQGASEEQLVLVMQGLGK